MMIHLEGAVVESFYDIFLYSWHHKMTPVLPCVVEPPKHRRDHRAKAADFQFQDQNPYLNDIELVKAAKTARRMLNLEKDDDDRLAKLRSDAEKEGLFGGYGGRFQAALGAIAESRRGSFSADARDQDLLKDGDATAAGASKTSGPGKFTDVVFKAMEARRKGFGTSKTESTTTSPQNGFANPTSMEDKSAKPALHVASDPQPLQVNTHASSADQPSLVNWNQPSDVLEGLHKEMRELDSPARARYNAQSAQAFVAESQYRDSMAHPPSTTQKSTNHQQSQFLPALDLPGASLRTPTGSAAPSMHSSSSTQGQDAHMEPSKRVDVQSLQPPTQGEHSLSPVPSERSSASHPNTSSISLEQANEVRCSKGESRGSHGPNGMSSAIPMRVRDYAVSESASAENTPALAYSQHSAATEPSSKGPDTPPATSAGPPVPANQSAAWPRDSEATLAASTSKGPDANQGSSSRNLFSHILDPSGKPLTTFKFSSFAERRNMNISTGSSSAGSKPPPKKNWIEGRKLPMSTWCLAVSLLSLVFAVVLGKGAKAGPALPPPEVQTPRQRALSNALNAGALSAAWSTVDDSDLLDEFNPHTLHAAHDPFPIAMVNRKPHGLPGHQDIRVPQDAAWLAGIRYAQKSVFMSVQLVYL